MNRCADREPIAVRPVSPLLPLPSRHLMRHHTLWKFGPPRQTHAMVAYSPSVRLVCHDWPCQPRYSPPMVVVNL